MIVLQHLTNMQSLLWLCQLKHTQSKETPTISNKTRAFQAKFKFSEGNVHNFWPMEFLRLKSTESDPNATISSETQNISQLDLFN